MFQIVEYTLVSFTIWFQIHDPRGRTMKSDYERWHFFTVCILKQSNLQSLWAPHKVYTNCGPGGMTMHQKMDVLIIIFNICPKKAVLREKERKIKLDHSLVFSCLHLLFTRIIIITFLCHGPLPFSTRAPLLPLPLQNLLDHVNG